MTIDKLTILHISDLHRSPNNKISNTSLLSSLFRDIDNCLKNEISKPDLIIVSGDIVQGSNDFDTASTTISEQYKEALDFLINLSNEFFSGDRNRIIIVPGNHDICWNESKLSMEKIDESLILNQNGELESYYLKEISKANSNIKWSWKERSFYKITNIDLYNERFKYFSDFYTLFYESKRDYKLDPEYQYEIFDFPNWGISIIGFNSCYNNDHLNRAGYINPHCISNVSLRLRKLKSENRLILAAWHHNTSGGPFSSDYMDNSLIQNFIADEIKIGFHGHQHKSEVIRVENNIIENKSMLILSAGSICAGPDELPAGHRQQYNILEINRKTNTSIELKVHSREKSLESNYENPIWHKSLFDSSCDFFHTELFHEKPKNIDMQELQEAERQIQNKNYDKAMNILLKLNKTDAFVRTLLLKCYIELDKNLEIIQDFIDPVNTSEAVVLINACLEENNKEFINLVYNVRYIQESDDPTIKQLKKKLEVKL